MIVTRFINPAIPDRRCDWVAYREGQEEKLDYGYGRTEREAILDLLDNEDKEPSCATSIKSSTTIRAATPTPI